MWRQRPRLEWLSAGDKNTRFFHLRVSQRRKKNMIRALANSLGVLCDDPGELKNMVSEFYECLHTTEGVACMEHVLDRVPTKVTPQMNEMLSAPYKNDEVKTALFQKFPTKAPGPDGFPAHFYQCHWDICVEEVTKTVMRIVRGEESAECVDDTVLVLIPKVLNRTQLSHFPQLAYATSFIKLHPRLLQTG